MRGLGAFELNTMELSTDWAAAGSTPTAAPTTAVINTASPSDKYTINVTVTVTCKRFILIYRVL